MAPRFDTRDSRLLCWGGWVGIKGLPFHLWKKKVFGKIGSYCGGLIKISRISEARIKVKKGVSGFIPTEFTVKESGTKWKVRLRVIKEEKQFRCSTDFSLMKVIRMEENQGPCKWQHGKEECMCVGASVGKFMETVSKAFNEVQLTRPYQQFQISNFIDNEKVGEDGNYDLDELSQD